MNIEKLSDLIIDLDNDPELRSFVFPNGMSYWLVIRYRLYLILRSLMVEGHEIGIKTPEPAVSSRLTEMKQKISNKLRSFKFYQNDLEVKKGSFDILNFFNATAVVNQGGHYASRITGFLNDVPGVTVLNIPQQPVFRSYAGSSCYMEAMLRSSFGARSMNSREISDIDRFVTLISYRSAAITHDVCKFVRDVLCSIATQTLAFDARIRGVLLKLKPEYVFVEEAIQGGWVESSIIRIANALGIQTAEFQHGSIDIAFRYGADLLSDPRVINQKPKYFLTFGSFFSKQTDLTSETIEIGNRFLETVASKPVICPGSGDALKILVIGQGYYTDNMFRAIANALGKLGRKFLLQIKEHPIFPPSSVAMELCQSTNAVQLSREGDVYEMIACSDVVIGYYSTVLMECLQFGKYPLVFKGPVSDEIIPQAVGKRFSSGDELAALINSPLASSDFKLDFYWKRNAIKNFTEFLELTTADKCAE